MPLKLNVGLSQKVGLPNYGSLGAACYVEVELDQSLLFDDLDQFQERVTHAYAACHQAVSDELSRRQSVTATTAPPRSIAASSPNLRASARQIAYARQLAQPLTELAGPGLTALSQTLFGSDLTAITSSEASALIHLLKRVRAGEAQLPALEEFATR